MVGFNLILIILECRNGFHDSPTAADYYRDFHMQQRDLLGDQKDIFDLTVA